MAKPSTKFSTEQRILEPAEPQHPSLQCPCPAYQVAITPPLRSTDALQAGQRYPRRLCSGGKPSHSHPAPPCKYVQRWGVVPSHPAVSNEVSCDMRKPKHTLDSPTVGSTPHRHASPGRSQMRLVLFKSRQFLWASSKHHRLLLQESTTPSTCADLENTVIRSA